MNLAHCKAKSLIKKSNYFFHRCLYLCQSAGQNQCPTESVHKSNLNICTLECYICSNHNCFPRCKTQKSDRLSCVILTFMSSNM